MNKPNRHSSHVVNRNGERYLEGKIPDEWHFTAPKNDYGIDYQVEISINNEVTGYNFSIQLKSVSKGQSGPVGKATLKHSTLSYYQVRLEPVMAVLFEADKQEAYWVWIDDLQIDLSKGNKNYTINIPKTNKLSEINWSEITNHVQRIFNNRSFISDFDISKIHNNIELAAWKVYNNADYEQAAYLFRRLIQDGTNSFNVQQALAWSLYQSYRYPEALGIINSLLKQISSTGLLQIKACILAEFGFSDNDKGKIIQARDVFKLSINEQATGLIYYNYGNTLSGLHDYAEAIKQYKLSLEKDPNFAQCWKNLGTTYGHLNNFEEELKCYDIALSINPNLQQALFSKGVTLTKDFKRYDEALELFNKVLSEKNNLTSAYINGLFWVAEAYEKTGDLQSALYWIDYGLNFAGTNPYFLNFKSNLLASKWPDHPELKKRAKSFFEYRIELNNDSRSLYHLIKLQQLTLDGAYPLLVEHTPLYKQVQLKDLIKVGFDIEMVLCTLLHLDSFAVFKKEHLVTRYVDHLISPYFSITGELWDLMDVICAYAFSKSIVVYGQCQVTEQIPAEIFAILGRQLPKLMPYLIEDQHSRSKEEIAEIFATIFQGLQTIVYREVGAQSGHITFQLKLRKVDPIEYISDKALEELQKNIYYALVEYLQPAG